MEQKNLSTQAAKVSNRRSNIRSERASVIVEFAMTAPLLLTLIIGIVGAGNVMMQLPWTAHTAYQLAGSLSENPSAVGQMAMESRLDQLRIERQSLFSHLGLVVYTPESLFPNSFYGTINGVEVVGVKFSASIRPIFNFRLPSAMNIEFTAPHLASSIDMNTISGFANPSESYDCCGIRCGDPGSQCGAPTQCYDSSSNWIASCPA